MAAIRTAIELQDNFTGILYQVIDSVNMGLSAMEDLHQTMNSPVDTASIEAARDSINQATIAVQELDAAMQGIESPAAPQSSVPIQIPVEAIVPDPLVNHAEPVQVPIHWQPDNLEVFTGSGIERFQQEVQSANNMLNTLNQTQSRIAATAAQTNLFPANAVADINNMGSRLQAVQQRIQQIEANPLNMGTDAANAELEQLRGQLEQAIQEQENLNRAVDNMDVQAANEAYLRLSHTIGGAERYIRDNVNEQGRFNREIAEGTAEANNLMNTIKGAVAAYFTIQTVGSGIGLSDSITQTTARLNLIVDDGGSVEELQNKIFASAQASRGSYLATADAVYKLASQASQAFSSNDEVIAFTELLNKQFTIAGTEVQGVNAAMLQLTQAMASGRLQGDELTSILENATPIVQNIQRYLQEVEGIDASNIKELAAEGQITAEIIKNSIFYMADEINAKFESMPVIFGQIWRSFQEAALKAFQPVLQRMNEIANSEAFQEFVSSAIEALPLVAGITLEIFNLIAETGYFIVENWSIIEPIIMGIVIALGLYCSALLIYNSITAITNFVEKVHAASRMMQAGATFAATAAQHGFNAALLACPITWIIILIIALIAIFYAAVAAVNKFAGTSLSATGIICGAFMLALAFIGNIFVALWNLVVDVFVLIYNLIVEVANFIGNVFTDPIGAVCRLFFGLADTVLGIIQSLASAIDTIFGSNLAEAVQGWRDSLGDWVDDTFGEGVEFAAKINADDLRLERFEYGDARNAGYSFGEGIEDKISNFNPFSLPDGNTPSSADYANMGSGAASIPGNVSDIADNTKGIKDGIDISNEDLKHMRDIAEMEAVNRLTTAEIRVEMVNNNTISGTDDIDGIVDILETRIEEAMLAVSEGAHV